jgi:hypothetical protein
MKNGELIFCLTVSLVIAGIIFYCMVQYFENLAVQRANETAKLKGRIGF